MKTLLIIISLFYLSCSGITKSNEKSSPKDSIVNQKSDSFKLNCYEPDIKELIVRTDTIINHNNYVEHIFKSFDRKGRLIQVFTSYLYESNSKKIYSNTLIYDTLGHLVYEDKVQEFIRWHCYSYKYDTIGHLIFKEGFSSGELGEKVTYFYKGDKLIKEISERLNGKIEKVY